MRGLIIVLFLFSFSCPVLAMTVGSPADMSVPEKSLYMKEQAVKDTLDEYEFNMNIKAGFDAEIISERKFSTASDSPDAEMEGQGYLIKLSDNFYNVFDPYVKIGTADFEVKWTQHGNSVLVETNPGFTWGVGTKAKVWESENCGIKLTLDGQYRHAELNVDTTKINGSFDTAAGIDEEFKIDEWQFTLLASKKYILPMGLKDLYMVPYAGITYTDLVADVHFTQSTTGLLYSIYDAGDKHPLGAVLGCDIMPSLSSWYLLSFELRLISEAAFTIGGTVKF